MIRPRTALVALVGLALAAPARGQEAAPPLAPRQVEIATPSVPVQMLAPDAHRLAERLGSAPTATIPAAPPPSGGGVRTITLPHPPVENPAPQFVFRDVTDRTEKVAVVVPPEQRRAAVEAFRQSLVKRKGGRR